MIGLAILGSVAVVSASGLLGLRMVLRHRERVVEHAPLTSLEDRIVKLERQASAAEFAKLNRR